ncbi:type IV pilus assembly protein PilM [Patescibacteria group bacterium]|nr:type IV pilus assembly protein PilM [Patescibacteria group bacterium]
MVRFPFKIGLKSCLGIDIGTSGIKIVQLSLQRERIKLEKYGEATARIFYEKPFRTFEKSTLLLSNQDIARAILAICKEAKISERKAIFAIPDFSSFFTSFNLPAMTREEVSQAVRFEARHHIPLPLAEVSLDWSIIEGELSDRKKVPLKILLAAVPNNVINQYRQIVVLSNLELKALEAEVFGLLRSLIGDDKRVIILLDIGAQSTSCNIIDQGILKVSHSFDVAGNELTQVLAKALNVDYLTAENLKKIHGLKFLVSGVPPIEKNQEIPLMTKKVGEILRPLIDLILTETKKTSRSFYQTKGKKVQKVIIAGGSALLPGLKEYFFKSLKQEVEIANPFSDILYSPILEETLKKMGPSYAIAVGMALRGLE